jgi:mercuric ion transport protein
MDQNKSDTLRKTSLGGSILAAITASLCCIGPLVAVALGASGFAASALFEKWRPLFLGVTFVLLALAWYLTYRKPKVACDEGSSCASKPVSKWNKGILWFSTAVVVIAAAFPSLSSAILRTAQTNSVTVADGNSAVLKVKIPSMDCAACALNIQTVLKKQPGVQQALVSFDTKEAVVQYDSAKLSPEKIIAAIDQTGFKAEPTTQKDQ